MLQLDAHTLQMLVQVLGDGLGSTSLRVVQWLDLGLTSHIPTSIPFSHATHLILNLIQQESGDSGLDIGTPVKGLNKKEL